MKSKTFEDFIDNMYQIYSMKVSKNCIEFFQGENRILVKLNVEKDRVITPTELSNELNISRQRVATILNSLKNKGLINMQIGQSDRRKIIVLLSEAGKKYISDKSRQIEKEMEIFFKKLGEEKLKKLNDLLTIINS